MGILLKNNFSYLSKSTLPISHIFLSLQIRLKKQFGKWYNSVDKLADPTKSKTETS
jgi:hypothetical protein